MDNPQYSRSAFGEAVRRAAAGGRKAHWSEWAPIADVAEERPEEWVRAFGALIPDDQHRLVDNLADPDAGAYADFALSMLAEMSVELSDPGIVQLIAFALEDVRGRHIERLSRARGRVEGLRGATDALRQRMLGTIDLAEEEVRLRAELDALRQARATEDPHLLNMYRIEDEIARAELRRQILARYDQAGQEAQLATLRQEVADLERQRTETEAKMERIDAERADAERMRRETDAQADASETRLRKAQAEAARAQSRQRKALEDFGRIEEEAKALDQRYASIGPEIERLQAEAAAKRKRVAAEQSRLDALRRDAQSAGLEDVVAAIQRVYELLPTDEAERQLSGNPRKTK